MSDGFGEGLKGAILGVTVGIVISAILQAVPSPYKELIEIGNLIQILPYSKALNIWERVIYQAGCLALP